MLLAVASFLLFYFNKLNTFTKFVLFIFIQSPSDIVSGLTKYQAGQCNVT